MKDKKESKYFDKEMDKKKELRHEESEVMTEDTNDYRIRTGREGPDVGEVGQKKREEDTIE